MSDKIPVFIEGLGREVRVDPAYSRLPPEQQAEFRRSVEAAHEARKSVAAPAAGAAPAASGGKVKVFIEDIGKEVSVDAAYGSLAPEQQAEFRKATAEAYRARGGEQERTWGEAIGRKARIVGDSIGRGAADGVGALADLVYLVDSGVSAAGEWTGKKVGILDDKKKPNQDETKPDQDKPKNNPDDTGFSIKRIIPEEYRILLGGVGGSDWIKDAASQAVEEATGYTAMDRNDMTWAERRLGDLVQGATSAVGPGGVIAVGARGSAKKAAAEAAEMAAKRGVDDAAEAGDEVIEAIRKRSDSEMMPKYATKTGRYVDQYASNPGRSLVTDASAGAVGQLGAEAALAIVPDSTIAALIGGAAGGTLGSAIPNSGSAVRKVGEGLDFRRNKTVDASNATVSHLADSVAKVVTDPAAVRESLNRSVEASGRYNAPTPIAGGASGDVGLMAIEKGYRAGPLQEAMTRRDSDVQRSMGIISKRLEDPEANREAVIDAAQREVDSKINPVREEVDLAKDEVVDAFRRAEEGASPATSKRGNSYRDDASRRFDDEAVVGGLLPLTKRKNELYGNIDPEAKVPFDRKPVEDLVRSNRLNPLLRGTRDSNESSYAQSFLAKLGKDEETTLRDVVEVIPRLRAEEDALRNSPTPNVPKAEAIRDLRVSLQKHIDEHPEGKAASTFYKESFAPVARDGAEGQKFHRKVVKAMSAGGRGEFPPPERTLGDLLRSETHSKAMIRIRDTAKNKEEANKAVSDYVISMVGDAATKKKSKTTANGTVVEFEVLDPAKLDTFEKNNRHMIDATPETRAQFDELKRIASSADEQIAQSQRRLDDTMEALSDTERKVKMSAASKLINGAHQTTGHVTDEVKKILSSNSNTRADQMAELHNIVKDDPDALRGLQAAVSDVIIARMNGKDSQADLNSITPSDVKRALVDNRDIIEKIYPPEHMQVIDDLIEMSRPLDNMTRYNVKGGLGNSVTASFDGMKSWIRNLTYLRTGNAITASSNSKVFETMVNITPAKTMTPSNRANHLMMRLMMDPEAMSRFMNVVEKRAGRPNNEFALSSRFQGIRQAARASSGAPEDEDDEVKAAIKRSE